MPPSLSLGIYCAGPCSFPPARVLCSSQPQDLLTGITRICHLKVRLKGDGYHKVMAVQAWGLNLDPHSHRKRDVVVCLPSPRMVTLGRGSHRQGDVWKLRGQLRWHCSNKRHCLKQRGRQDWGWRVSSDLCMYVCYGMCVPTLTQTYTQSHTHHTLIHVHHILIHTLTYHIHTHQIIHTPHTLTYIPTHVHTHIHTHSCTHTQHTHTHTHTSPLPQIFFRVPRITCLWVTDVIYTVLDIKTETLLKYVLAH